MSCVSCRAVKEGGATGPDQLALKNTGDEITTFLPRVPPPALLHGH